MTAKWRWLAALLLTGGILAATLPATLGQDKKDDKKADVKDEAAPPDEVVADVILAAHLAENGKKHKSPESLLAAASILYSLKTGTMTALTEKPTDENGKALEEKALESKSFGDQAKVLFEDASFMATEQKLPGFDALIKAIKERKTRDIVGGPRTITQAIRGGQTQLFRFQVIAGRPLTIGYAASFPMRFQIVRDDIGAIWADSVTTHDTHSGVPGGKGDKQFSVTIRIANIGKEAGQYQLFVR